MIINIEGPPGDDLCAGQPHLYKATGCESALTVEWIVIDTPDAVSKDEVIFGSPGAEETTITVPLRGKYSFAIKCCEAA